MKKILLFLSILTCSFSVFEKNIYTLHFKSLDKGEIDMSSYKGRKILIVAFDAGNPDRKQLRSLDTLYRQIATYLAVIAVPADDFNTAMSPSSLIKLLRDSLGLSYPITEISKARKDKGNLQHDLLQWLTSKDNNQHFDDDIAEQGQMYVVSETGILYASFKKNVTPAGKVLKEVLGRRIKE